MNAMTDAGLIARLRDDVPYVLCEKHWITDWDAIEEQRAEAADRIEALSAENARLCEALRMLDEAYCNEDYSTLEGKAKGRAALVAARAALAARGLKIVEADA